MVVIDFCSTNNTFECFVESALGIVPVAGFLFFGYYSYRETRARTAYLRQAYTFRHLSKLLLSGLLALLALAFVALYTILESEISLKTEVTYGVTCLLWMLNTFLLRCEYKTLGFTTNYLRYAWIIMFVCQTALLIFAAAGANTDSFEKVAAVYIINDIAILAIIIVGYSYVDDFPNTRVHEAYGTVLSNDSIINVDDEHFRNLTTPLDRPTRTKEEAAFKPFAADVPEQTKNLPVRRIDGSFNSDNSEDDRKHRKGDKKNASKLLTGSSMQVNLKEDIRLIETIEVKTFEEIRRFDKPTIIYTITYVIKGQQFSTKRSYSEFVELRQEAKKDAGDMSLPKIPGKKKIGKTRDEESLANRAEAFDKLLKVMVREKVSLNNLAIFLLSTSALPYYGKGKKPTTEETKKDISKASMSSTKSDKNEVKTKVLDTQGGRVIADYTQSEANRNQNMMEDSKYYIVETLNTYEDDSSTFYKFNIREKDSGMEYNIEKRYSDFKAFHEELKKSASGNDKKSIPELPYKDNVKGFAWRDNPKVIEFRKVALKTYLQTILNNDKFQNTAVVRNFVVPSNI